MFYGNSIQKNLIILSSTIFILLLSLISLFLYYSYCIRKGKAPEDKLLIDSIYQFAVKLSNK